MATLQLQPPLSPDAELPASGAVGASILASGVVPPSGGVAASGETAASGGVTHCPPMHTPVVPHAVPSVAAPQAPFAPHAWQMPLQALSQHTLLTQKPDMH